MKCGEKKGEIEGNNKGNIEFLGLSFFVDNILIDILLKNITCAPARQLLEDCRKIKDSYSQIHKPIAFLIFWILVKGRY